MNKMKKVEKKKKNFGFYGVVEKEKRNNIKSPQNYCDRFEGE